MATYLPGVKDYVPQLETFKPDYKFLSDVLSVRQDRYDSNFKSINDLYSKVVYAPMTRQDNLEQREQYANQLSNGLKQVSGMDLSLGANVNTAKALFRPFFEDKALVKDMTFTNLYGKTMQGVDRLRTSSNDDQVGKYWQDGVVDLQWQMEQFKNNDAKAALSQGMPTYVENPDLYQRSFDALKESGLSIKQTTLDGDWIVTTQNGSALTRQVVGYKRDPATNEVIYDENKNPIPEYANPAAEFLKETVMTDPRVIQGYMVQARNRARSFSNDEANIQKYGSVEGAEKEWARSVMSEQAYKDLTKLAEENKQVANGQSRVNNWESYKSEYGITKGTSTEEIYLRSIMELGIVEKTRGMTTERIKQNKAPADDMSQLMSKAYQSYMASVIGPEMSKAATAYSQIDAERTFKHNPFKKMEYEHKFQINKMALQNAYDLDKMKIKFAYDSALEEQKNAGNTGGNLPGGDLWSEDANASITGALTMVDEDGDGIADTNWWGSLKESDLDLIGMNEQAIVDGYNEVDNQQAAFITMAINDFGESFIGADWMGANGVSLKYKYVDEQDRVFDRDKPFNAAMADLKTSNDGGAALDAIYKDIKVALDYKFKTKEGGTVAWQIPSSTMKPDRIVKYNEINQNITEANILLQKEVEKQQTIYSEVNRIIMEGSVDAQRKDTEEGGTPPMLLTQGEQNELAKGYNWNQVRTQSEAGNLTETNLDANGNPMRTTLSEEQYVENYVAMVGLTNDQRNAMDQFIRDNPTTPGSYYNPNVVDNFPWLLAQKNPWYRDDIETVAEEFWTLGERPLIAGSGGYRTSKDGVQYGVETYGPAEWKFNETAAIAQAKEEYKKMRANLNSQMTKPSAGGENGLPTVNTRARLAGQVNTDTSGGGVLYQEYNTVYDHENPTESGVLMLNTLFNNMTSATSSQVHFGLGDTRNQPWSKVDKTNASAAKSLVEQFYLDYKSNFGLKNDKTGHPNVKVSYIEQGGGLEGSLGNYAVYKLTFGTDYVKKFESTSTGTNIITEGQQEPGGDFADKSVTVYVPKANDTNPYSSINQMMNTTDLIIKDQGFYNGGVANGSEYMIYVDGNGQYQQRVTSYFFNEKSGTIDAYQPFNIPITVSPGQLDNLRIRQDMASKAEAEKNIAELQEFNRKNATRK